MLLRTALCLGLACAAFGLAEPQRSYAQTPPPAAPEAKPAAPAPAPTPAPAATPADPFGEEVTLTAKTIVFTKGTGTWDNAFETITKAFKSLRGYLDKQGIKPDGPLTTIFLATDDTGFQYQAAIPIGEPPKTPPGGLIAVGKSPEGKALKFVHRGSYDGLDDTYEAITNYLDEKRLDTKDMFIEEYVTDPLATAEDKLVVNVFVPIK
jgi:effector-binding domain-containing protein